MLYMSVVEKMDMAVEKKKLEVGMVEEMEKKVHVEMVEMMGVAVGMVQEKMGMVVGMV